MINLPRGKRQSRIIKSIPAPIKGWNARDPIAMMDEGYAVTLDNMWPTTADIEIRDGWDEHAYGLGDQVESLMPYNTPVGNDLLFVAAGDSIYDATGATAVGTAEVSGLTNARFQSVNFTNSDGDTYLVAVNGEDNMLYYNGATWLEITNTSTPLVSGVSTADFIGVMVHKRRLWFVEKDTLNAWYLPVDSVGGVARKFSLAGITTLGGYLMALGTWTLDAGAGPDDYWVGITSEGEVAVYQGTDPNSVTTWGLVGVWRIGQPLGRRCLFKYQGDLLIACVDGVLPLSKALISSRVDPRVALTDSIDGAMSDAATLYKQNFGWEVIFLPSADMILLNVPQETGANQKQFVMNTITGAWARFTNIEANTWCVFNEDFYFGGDGYVGKFWDTPSDNGDNIFGDVLTAFNYFGSRSELKRFSLARPIITSNGIPSVQIGVNVDYNLDGEINNTSFSPVQYGVWDTAIWDQALWGGALSVYLAWQGVSGIGFCVAARLYFTSQGIDQRLQAIDFVYEKGTFIT